MKLASRASRPGLTVGFPRNLCNVLCTVHRFHAEDDEQTCRIGCPTEPDTLSYYNECLRLYNMCAEVSLVKRAHSLFGRNAQQVVYELQVRDDGRSATGGA